jgi:hypothetical protein
MSVFSKYFTFYLEIYPIAIEWLTQNHQCTTEELFLGVWLGTCFMGLDG